MSDDAPHRSGVMRAVPEDKVAKIAMAVLTAALVAAVSGLGGLFLKVNTIETKLEAMALSQPKDADVQLLKLELKQLREDRQRDNTQDAAIAKLETEAKERASLWWCRYSWTKDSIYDLQVAARIPRTSPPSRCNE